MHWQFVAIFSVSQHHKTGKCIERSFKLITIKKKNNFIASPGTASFSPSAFAFRSIIMKIYCCRDFSCVINSCAVQMCYVCAKRAFTRMFFFYLPARIPMTTMICERVSSIDDSDRERVQQLRLTRDCFHFIFHNLHFYFTALLPSRCTSLLFAHLSLVAAIKTQTIFFLFAAVIRSKNSSN